MRVRCFVAVGLAMMLPFTAACGGAGGEVVEEAKGGVGDPCEQGDDCASGLCIDLSELDDGCKGKVCSQLCESSSDCPEVAQERDCDPIGEGESRKDVCLYGEWESRYCE